MTSRIGRWVGLVGGLVALGVAAAGCGGSGAEAPRNLLIVSWDTTRADHLSLYGYERPTTPVLDELAERSFVFTRAFAQETNTNPSHASLFTGLYPHVHGSMANGMVLDSEVVTLAEILRAAGFRTGAFLSGYTLVAEVSGLDQGFDVYDDELGGNRRPGPRTVGRALAWLRDLPPEERFFAFVHSFDAHGRYRPSRENRGRFRSPTPGPELERFGAFVAMKDARGRVIRNAHFYVDRYDEAIRTNDDQLARLLREVDLDETAVLLFADHGETLTGRWWSLGHGGAVFEEQIRIPLVLHVPGRGGATVDSLVESVDLLPTLLAVLEVDPPPGLEPQGQALPAVVGGEAAPKSRIFAASRAHPASHGDRGYELDPESRIHSVRGERWKLVRYPVVEGPDPVELYDLESDPGEKRPSAGPPEVRERLTAELDAWLAKGEPGPGSPDLTDAQRERLEALGYLDAR